MSTEGNAPELPAKRRAVWRARAGRLVDAIREGDDAAVEQAGLRLSRSRPWPAPPALVGGGFFMLSEAIKLLVTNWRLTLIQVLPAMWIWFAMFDLKAHVLHGRSFHVLTGWILIPIVLAIAAITAASFFLNAVFAFAIAGDGPPLIRPAVAQARSHLAVILTWGAVVGTGLGLATMVFT